MLTPYRTVRENSETEYIINKSRFIGRAYPVQTEEEALNYLSAIRKKHYDATHNCYAYVMRDGTARYSDDGEPQGTAGMPIMEVIKAKKLVNVLVIVTRYFGGILLGAGGLVRAYSRSCADALSDAHPVSAVPGTLLKIRLDYARYNAIEDFLRSDLTVTDVEYTEQITVTAVVRTDDTELFLAALTERTDGRVTAEITGEEYMFSDD